MARRQLTGLERDRLKYTGQPTPTPQDLLPQKTRGTAAEAAFRAAARVTGAAAASAAATVNCVQLDIELETVDQVCVSVRVCVRACVRACDAGDGRSGECRQGIVRRSGSVSQDCRRPLVIQLLTS